MSVVFSHQSIGDLDKVGESFRKVVLTNTNIKCIMRNNDPDSCEYFSRSLGTKKTEKRTESRRDGIFGDQKTGAGSVREVEEFLFHPNLIKGFGTGEGLVTVPHPKGMKILQLKFMMREDLPFSPLPNIEKEEINLEKIEIKTNQDTPQGRSKALQFKKNQNTVGENL